MALLKTTGTMPKMVLLCVYHRHVDMSAPAFYIYLAMFRAYISFGGTQFVVPHPRVGPPEKRHLIIDDARHVFSQAKRTRIAIVSRGSRYKRLLVTIFFFAFSPRCRLHKPRNGSQHRDRLNTSASFPSTHRKCINIAPLQPFNLSFIRLFMSSSSSSGLKRSHDDRPDFIVANDVELREVMVRNIRPEILSLSDSAGTKIYI